MVSASAPLSSKLQTLSFWAILLFLGECTLGSSGRWLEIGPLSIRMLLFALCFLLTLPLVLGNFSQIMRKPPVLFALLFGGWLLVSGILGWKAGHAPGFIAADITAFLTLALLPGFLAVISDRHRLMDALKVIFAGSTLLSLAVCGIHYALSGQDPELITAVNDFLNRHSLGGLALLSTGMHRIYMKSQIFTPVSLMIGVWLLGNSRGKQRIFYYLCEALQLFNLILSFTRGMWLGFGVSALLVLLFHRWHFKTFLTIGGITAGLTAVLILLSCALYRGPFVPVEIINRFSPSLMVGHMPQLPEESLSQEPDLNGDGIISESEQQTIVEQNNTLAVALRAETLAAAKELIRSAPILGHGLGTNLDNMREDGKIEYMYWDILMKSGLIGLSLFLLTFLYVPLSRLWHDFRKGIRKISWDSDNFLWHILFVSYMGVCLNSYFNPFLSNPMGIMIMMITVSASYVLTNQVTGKDDHS